MMCRGRGGATLPMLRCETTLLANMTKRKSVVLKTWVFPLNFSVILLEKALWPNWNPLGARTKYILRPSQGQKFSSFTWPTPSFEQRTLATYYAPHGYLSSGDNIDKRYTDLLRNIAHPYEIRQISSFDINLPWFLFPLYTPQTTFRGKPILDR